MASTKSATTLVSSMLVKVSTSTADGGTTLNASQLQNGLMKFYVSVSLKSWMTTKSSMSEKVALIGRTREG